MNRIGSNRSPIERDLTPRFVPIDKLEPLGRETRHHPKAQIRKIARSLEAFGFVLPLVVDAEFRVIHGAAVLDAARLVELTEVPVVVIEDLSEAQTRTLRIALNRLSEDARWDVDELRIELGEIELLDANIDFDLSGFDGGEIDSIMLGDGSAEEDELPPIDEKAVPRSQPGDLYQLGGHRIFCGNALEKGSYQALMSDDLARLVVTDPPYNVEIDGHATGLGRTRHREFAMASGEMSSPEFTSFLERALQGAADASTDGALAFFFMDWRHLAELQTAGHAVFGNLLNLIVWSKPNAGMGSFYRSAHELVALFKKGSAPHINNIQLGRHGRHRTNVWRYAGQSQFNGSRKSKLSLHPTVKPLAMIADAIRDASNVADIVLDPFGGAGTTLVAAEKTNRRARLIEIDPLYVDVTIDRWERLTGGRAELLTQRPPPKRRPARGKHEHGHNQRRLP